MEVRVTGMGGTVRTRLVLRLLQGDKDHPKESVTVLMSCVKQSEQMDVLLLYYYLDFIQYILHIYTHLKDK